MRIVMIGSGNLGTQLGIELIEKGHQVIQVYSRTVDNAKELAAKLNCVFTDKLTAIASDADLYIIAIKDSAIESVLSGVNFGENLVVHTAGAIGMDVFIRYCKNYGVFYPLQTFSKQRRTRFTEIPVCLEANSEENLQKLELLAASLSERVYKINSEKRLTIHLAAVFACNFVNHFYAIGKRLLKEKGIDFSLFSPLIMETAFKALNYSPETVQTGPATRKDSAVMEKHLQMLENYPEWAHLYKLISENIYQEQKNKHGIF